ncbi:MAG TPA: SGNH/GDSL hydrolase family protein [Chthoniobacteraceae bacterium]|nr:SGNH/GDSL hydrolase family protein [Chthoniobacteraceae bacterium]
MRNKPRLKSLVAALAVATAFHQASAGDPQPLVKDGQKIAFLGDSITANGWGSPGGYVRLIVDGLAHEGVKVTPIPAGVSGNTSRDMLARLGPDILDKHPDWMTLSCGVNDVWHGDKGVDLETYKQNITSIVDQATAKGIKVVILTSTPIGEDDNANNKKLAAYNDFLRQLAKERGLPLADLSADFQEALAKFKLTPASRNLTVDGVHMNPEGNILMAAGCLRAFGIPDAGLEKIETAWLSEPNLATVPLQAFNARSDIGITLGQYRQLAKAAQARNTDIAHLCDTLWLKALSEVVQSHAQEPLLDDQQIQKETTARMQEKIAAVLKE